MKQFARTIVIVITIVMFGSGSPVSADYQAGVDAYSSGDFRKALAEWLPLAEAGDATAQNAVGALYDHGLGVDEDDAAAVHWYQLAADQNLPLAMRNLGNMYAGGYGIEFDKVQAEEWFKKAASLGDPVAIKRLAGMSPSGAQFAAAAAPAAEPTEPESDSEEQAAAVKPAAGTTSDVAEAPPAVPVGEVDPAAAPEPIAEAPVQSDESQQVADSDDAPQYGDVAAAPAPAQPATTQQAAVTQPPAASADPSNWLIGMWQGPSLGCPPGGGLEFVPGETRSYYQGQIAATLKAKYEVSGDKITVTTIGVDGVGRAYGYERTGPDTFKITSVPAEMPKSMVGAEHRRCAGAPLAAAAAPASKPAATAQKPAATAQKPAATTPPSAPAKVAQPVPAAAPKATQSAAQLPKKPAGSTDAGWDAFGKGDYAGALAVWEPLAEKGDTTMQLLVGSIYDYGQGVPQNDAEAVKWYEMAAKSGSAKGQFQAGAVYARSAQVKDPVQAYKWLTIAARTLSEGSRDGITADQATTLRALVEGQMSEAEISKAKQEADAFKAKNG